jgi:hypothetical protein
MILLRPDCLVFENAAGENIPCSVKEVTIEFVGDAVQQLDTETLENAAAAVLHYFRVEQGRQSVTVAEFSAALETALSSLGIALKPELFPSAVGSSAAGALSLPKSFTRPVVESDLSVLAGEGGELFFFPRLRNELRSRLGGSPLVLRFHGLRACVRHLTGAKRWTPQCRALNDQIVEYLRTCFVHENAGPGSALVVL